MLAQPAADEMLSVRIAARQGKTVYQSGAVSVTGGKMTVDLPQKLSKGSYVVEVFAGSKAVSSKILLMQ